MVERALAWFRRKWDDLSTEIVAFLIITMLLAIVALIRPVLPSWPWPIWVLVVLVVFGVIVWVFNQYALWKVRNQSYSGVRPLRLERIIRRWLDEHGYAVANTAQPNAVFSLGVHDPNNRRFTLLMARGAERMLMVATRYTIPQDRWTRLDAQPEGFFRDIRIELVKTGINYEGIVNPLREVVLSEIFPVDTGLTEAEFFQRVDNLRKAIVLLTQLEFRAQD